MSGFLFQNHFLSKKAPGDINHNGICKSVLTLISSLQSQETVWNFYATVIHNSRLKLRQIYPRFIHVEVN